MGYPHYRQDLLATAFDADWVLDKYFHSGQSVVFNGAPPGAEAALKRHVAKSLGGALNAAIHPLQLVLCGSAHLGFSPVPNKIGKPFDPTSSDIDVAVVSEE